MYLFSYVKPRMRWCDYDDCFSNSYMMKVIKRSIKGTCDDERALRFSKSLVSMFTSVSLDCLYVIDIDVNYIEYNYSVLDCEDVSTECIIRVPLGADVGLCVKDYLDENYPNRKNDKCLGIYEFCADSDYLGLNKLGSIINEVVYYTAYNEFSGSIEEYSGDKDYLDYVMIFYLFGVFDERDFGNIYASEWLSLSMDRFFRFVVGYVRGLDFESELTKLHTMFDRLFGGFDCVYEFLMKFDAVRYLRKQGKDCKKYKYILRRKYRRPENFVKYFNRKYNENFEYTEAVKGFFDWCDEIDKNIDAYFGG